jgi:uncharacterized membrane protein YfcA
MTETLLAIAFGALVGLALGSLGGGGSIIAVPALVYGLGLTVHEAIPTSLIAVGLAAAAGALAHRRAGRVLVPIALAFSAAGIVGSVAGAWANHRVADGLVLGGLAVLMVIASVGMWRRAARDAAPAAAPVAAPGAADPEGQGAVEVLLSVGMVIRIAAVGAGLGFLTGLFGVGGGFLVVPAMALLLGLPTEVAIGTSLAVITVNALAAFVAHVGLGGLDVAIAVVFTIGGLVGAVLGQRLTQHVGPATLGRAFAVLVAALGAFTLTGVLLGIP